MVWTAFILGFAGSLHCMGMCSPLAMAVTNRSPGVFLNRVFYNFGRILTYGVLGSLVASSGMILSMGKYQNFISLILGFALVAIGISGLSKIRIPFFTDALSKFTIFLKALFAGFLKTRSYQSTFLLGSLNGFLPCGLTFLALTYCISLSGPADGFYFMVLFGSGTLPVMLGFTSIFQWTIKRLHFSTHRLATTMLILSGILLIARVFIVHLPQTGPFGSVVDIVVCR